MTMKMVVLFCSTVLPVVAHAQTTNPQTARSPLSLHDTVGAPDNLTLRASVRTRLESIDGQARPNFNPSDRLVEVRSTLFAEYQTGPLRFGAEIYDSRAYGGDLKTPIGTNEVNVAELVQAYVAADFEAPLGKGTKAKLQAGRMALNAGSRRLVSSEEWRNTTNSYMGLRGDIVLPKGLSTTVFYVQPTIRLPDDKPNLLENAHRADRESSAVTLWGDLLQRPKSSPRPMPNCPITTSKKRTARADLREIATWTQSEAASTVSPLMAISTLRSRPFNSRA